MKKIVITIARSYGSGGRTLGKLLAKDLGIPCYDRELIRMVSDESGINEALFGAADEVKRGLFFKGPKPYKGSCCRRKATGLCPMTIYSICRPR